MKEKILIIGSGGREHALAWKLKQSPRVEKIYIAPGNAGTSFVGENVPISANDILALADFAQKNQIDFTVVGPDDALALGIVDEFKKRGLKIWGPSKAAAQIEASKAFAKELMKKQGIPTAGFKMFDDYEKAFTYIKNWFAGVGEGFKPSPTEVHKPVVIKASGLALGKGVAVCKTLDEAKKFLQDVMLNKIFGDSGKEVIIEEFLQGQEFSIHAFSDGNNFQLLPSSQDHKPIYDGGLGPNTGGMGTIAPVPWVSEAMMNDVSSRIVKPELEGLKNLGSPFVGLLYPGLMAVSPSPSGRGVRGEGSDIKVIEFNARFGDPETQSYMRLLKTDLLDILEACVNGNLDKIKIEWSKKSACCIVLASGGYPGKYEKGKAITGIKEAEKLDDIVIFHAGTILLDSNIVTNGGRVLGVTAVADDLRSALSKAYHAIKLIHFDGIQYRKDIGAKSLSAKPPSPHGRG
jgi:phosphoribosylamine--glycine ligase